MLVNAAHTLCALKRTLRSDVGNFEKDLMYRAGIEMFHCYMHREECKPDHSDERALLDHLTDLLARDGLGTFEIVRFDMAENMMEFVCLDSLEAFGYLNHGEVQKSPSCSFTCGVLAGVGKHVFGIEDCEGPNEIVATEVSCASSEAPACRFLVGSRHRLEALGHKVDSVKESVSEHALRLNDDILTRNLDLQNLNLDLERKVRRQSEELKRSEERYRSLMNLSPNPIVVCLMDGTIRSFNDAALNLLGYSRDDMLREKNISSLILDGTAAWDRCIWLVNREGALRDHEIDFVKKKGGKVSAEVSARISDTHPERCVIIVVRDVTELDALRAKTEQAKEECDFINDLVSSDILNYMSTAMHFLDRIRSFNGLTDEHARALAAVAKDVRGTYELASVVSDMSKADALEENGCKSATDLCGTISDAVEDAKMMYADRRVSISVEKPASGCYAEGTPLLSRMFLNMLTNAIKFDPSDEAVVDIRIEPVTHKGIHYWSVRISDRGKGIPDHEKEKIFDRYFRGDTGISGAGLGLHVARKVARACGGLVWAENRVQGDYTKGTVMVTLLKKASEGQNNHTR